MPHDVNGELISDNDIVWVKCKVSGVSTSEEACNVTVQPVLPPCGSTYNTIIVLNTQQVMKNPGWIDPWDEEH